MDLGLNIILFWFICALIAGSIYRSKGHSKADSYLAGFVLGPLGILLAALSDQTSKPLPKQVFKPTEIKPCPYCGKTIHAQVFICKHCGSAIHGAYEDKRNASLL
jgi:hypothetical protein